MKDINTLLVEREITGLRFIMLFRLTIAILSVFLHLLVGKTMFEKLSTALLTALILLSTVWFLQLLRRKRLLTFVGITGALLDVLMLALLPVIWYTSVGGDSIPAAYMLKTPSHLAMGFSFLIINSFATRPLYPMIVTIGFLLIYAGLIGYAAHDPSTIFSNNFVSHALGSTVSTEFITIVLFTFVGMGASLTWFSHVSRKTVVEAVHLERTTQQLRRYFSPNIFNEIASTSNQALSVGKRQHVAVMFADIRDFTAMSETMPPEEVVQLLSAYHARMVASIFAFGGTLDKFIGDGIMATFGTPEPLPDDALRAVQAGLSMKRALQALNEERAQKNLSALRQGIGIHYGEVVAGNIGSEDRLEYTVIGDTVNIASRIEGACKEVNADFLISSAVVEQLAEHFTHHPPADIAYSTVGEIALKGKSKPISLFAVRS